MELSGIAQDKSGRGGKPIHFRFPAGYKIRPSERDGWENRHKVAERVSKETKGAARAKAEALFKKNSISIEKIRAALARLQRRSRVLVPVDQGKGFESVVKSGTFGSLIVFLRSLISPRSKIVRVKDMRASAAS